MLAMNHTPRRFTNVTYFITRTYIMVNDPRNSEVITWTDSGDSFVICDIYFFASAVLPRYFSHKNLSSFIRNLNKYGFRKMFSTGGTHIYSHPCFLRDHPEKLTQLKIKDSDVFIVTPESLTTLQKYPVKRSKHVFLQERLLFIEKSFQDLSKSNKYLMAQIQQYKDREQKVGDFLNTLAQRFKEIPSVLETLFMNFLETQSTQPLEAEVSDLSLLNR